MANREGRHPLRSRLIRPNRTHPAHLESERCLQGTETARDGILAKAVTSLLAITTLVDARLLDRAVVNNAGMSSVAWRPTQEGN